MAVPMDAFPDGTYLFGNALAGLVLHRSNYLKACETKCFKSKPGDEFYCSCSNAFSLLTCSNPVSKIGKVMLPVDLINSTATKETIIFRINNNEVIFNALRPHLVPGVKP